MRFVDTSFWVALQFQRDRDHEQASSIWRHEPGAVITTNHVLGETWTFLRRRLGPPPACRFLSAVRESPRGREAPCRGWSCWRSPRATSAAGAPAPTT
ncbi:MAG: type II toxin-antitoxin system VapC family toxin [Candidatus Dormibacteria bacterium]